MTLPKDRAATSSVVSENDRSWNESETRPTPSSSSSSSPSSPQKRRHVLMILLVVALAAAFMMDTRLVQMSKISYVDYGLFRETNRTSSNKVVEMERLTMVDSEDMLSFHRPPRHTRKPPSRTQLAFFYNTYISDKEPETAHAIIEEQINKVGTASFLTSPQFNITIYYSTISNPLPNGFMEKLCTKNNRLTCQHIGHYKTGNEEVTLASLYEYCQHHPDERVVYIHSKGKKVRSNSFLKAIVSYRLLCERLSRI